MSRTQTLKVIRREIDRLNQQIDLAIIQGRPYRRAAARHRFLMSQLQRLSPRVGLMDALFNFKRFSFF